MRILQVNTRQRNKSINPHLHTIWQKQYILCSNLIDQNLCITLKISTSYIFVKEELFQFLMKNIKLYIFCNVHVYFLFQPVQLMFVTRH